MKLTPAQQHAERLEYARKYYQQNKEKMVLYQRKYNQRFKKSTSSVQKCVDPSAANRAYKESGRRRDITASELQWDPNSERDLAKMQKILDGDRRLTGVGDGRN